MGKLQVMGREGILKGAWAARANVDGSISIRAVSRWLCLEHGLDVAEWAKPVEDCIVAALLALTPESELYADGPECAGYCPTVGAYWRIRGAVAEWTATRPLGWPYAAPESSRERVAKRLTC